MNKLLKDAIADAKAVRETALANAKFALQEAFAPKIQSMLSHKIKEEMEEEEEVEEPSNDEQAALESRMRNNTGLYEDDDIFGDETGEGADDVAGNDPEAVAEGDEDEEYSDDRGLESEPADDDQISDEELAELIRELEGEDEAEVEAPAEEEELEEGEDEEYEEAPTSEGRKKNKMKMMEMEDEEVSDEEGEEEVNIEEIIRALREEDEEGAEDTKAAEETEEELEEAYKVIKFLRSKLHEVNLLNAKLLYVNKLIKKEGLTESQKIKIIETFDRAKNVREAKLIYTTLAESVMKRIAKVSTTKTKMVEGFASKGQKPTTKILSENKIYNRFTELVKFNR